MSIDTSEVKLIEAFKKLEKILKKARERGCTQSELSQLSVAEQILKKSQNYNRNLKFQHFLAVGLGIFSFVFLCACSDYIPRLPLNSFKWEIERFKSELVSSLEILLLSSLNLKIKINFLKGNIFHISYVNTYYILLYQFLYQFSLGTVRVVRNYIFVFFPAILHKV